MVEDPIEQDPVVEDPIEQDPVVEDPIEQDPIVEDPNEEDPIVEGPIEQDPIIEDPIEELPLAGNEPVTVGCSLVGSSPDSEGDDVLLLSPHLTPTAASVEVGTL